MAASLLAKNSAGAKVGRSELIPVSAASRDLWSGISCQNPFKKPKVLRKRRLWLFIRAENTYRMLQRRRFTASSYQSKGETMSKFMLAFAVTVLSLVSVSAQVKAGTPSGPAHGLAGTRWPV